jgi:plastocyanin
MNETLEPGGLARRLLLRRVLGVGIVMAIGSRAATAAVGADAEIIVDNFTFSPVPLMVKAGATVTWVNHDDIPHSIVCPMLKMKSHPMDTDETFAYRFEQGGTYDYICGLHPHMHGQVVVAA